MTEKERDKLQQEYCVKIVQDMTDKDRISFTYNVLMDSYYNWTDSAFLAEVQSHFPELITVDVKAEK